MGSGGSRGEKGFAYLVPLSLFLIHDGLLGSLLGKGLAHLSQASSLLLLGQSSKLLCRFGKIIVAAVSTSASARSHVAA